MAIKGERSLPQLSITASLCLRLKTDLEGNPTPPPTPPELQQGYTIGECNTDEANQYQSGVNFHQSPQVGPAGAYHSRDWLTVVQNAPSSTTITDLGAGSIGDCNPSHPTCSAGSLMPVEAAGTRLSEGPGVETDNTASCVTGQELRMGLSK
jgi:hypothetical protein